jgi:hypothetical protein
MLTHDEYLEEMYPQLKKPKWQPDNTYWLCFGLMCIFLFLFCFGLGRVGASDFSEYTNEAIVTAIGNAENSVKFPYGIKSIPTHGDKNYARQICLNSVRNGRRRWINAGRPYDLIVYISLRFCPPQAHKLNRNWSRNVKYFLAAKQK